MNQILTAARSGSWLDRGRATGYPAILLVFYLAVVVWFVATSPDGLNASDGKPLGIDYSNIYAAGTFVQDGRPDAPFDPALQHGREKEIFGSQAPFLGWHYPPFFLAVAVALALLPYLASLAVWQASTFALYLLAMRGVLGAALTRDRLWLLIATAFPAVFVNLSHGHNGFLTTALLGGALVLLDRRPAMAGVLIGLLAYKPQFAALIPLVLIVTGRWTTFFAAGLTVAAMCVGATVAFGWDVWSAFLKSTEFTRVVVLEAGGAGWPKIQSVFSAIRMWGGSIDMAYAGQGMTILTLAGLMIWLWRSSADENLKKAALAVALLLATPYVLDYDMTALAVAIGFLVAYGTARGFRPWMITVTAFAWIAPLFARPVALTIGVPLGVFSMIVFCAAICIWAREDARRNDASKNF